MASYIEKGDSIFIPFRNGRSISDSQCRPRMYKSLQNFEKSFPTHNLGTKNIELVEYKEVVHGEWTERFQIIMDSEIFIGFRCTACNLTSESKSLFCPNCGAKMDGERKVD